MSVKVLKAKLQDDLDWYTSEMATMAQSGDRKYMLAMAVCIGACTALRDAIEKLNN
ncbi:hypothetical protein [Roseibium sp. Sym1]|uniref:hypothetical protein n=1 Tax=Roseibium sp. Sym1 TaxID=3016006 RepID=UPI0022B5C1ED|nr:hypothetical protein [Roseibium sp. Sym1]